MNSNDVLGINEDNLKKMVLEIYDYAEKINSILNTIDDLMLDTSQNFEIEGNKDLYSKFDLVKTNFLTIKDNINSYGETLLNAEQQYHLIEADITITTKKASMEISDKVDAEIAAISKGGEIKWQI